MHRDHPMDLDRLRSGVAKMKGEHVDEAQVKAAAVSAKEAILALIAEGTISQARVLLTHIDDLEQEATEATAQRAEAIDKLEDWLSEGRILLAEQPESKRKTIEQAQLEGRIASLEAVLELLGAGTS